MVFLNPPSPRALGGSIRGKSVGRSGGWVAIPIGHELGAASARRGGGGGGGDDDVRDEAAAIFVELDEVELRGGRGRGGQTEERTTCFVRFSTACV